MATPTLEKLGDLTEQKWWPVVQPHFPLYERFWQEHIFTLRDANGQVRADIDNRLELMAQAHYKCFISATVVIDSTNNPPERVFSSLQNCANRAQEVICLFKAVYLKCTGTKETSIDPSPLRTVAIEISRYRNLVHEDLVGVVIEGGSKQRFIPLPDKLTKYLRWSSLRSADLKDFVPLDDYIQATTSTLFKLIDGTWAAMLKISGDILTSTEYKKLLPPLPQPAAEVPVILTSNTQEVRSNIIRQPVARII